MHFFTPSLCTYLHFCCPVCDSLQCLCCNKAFCCAKSFFHLPRRAGSVSGGSVSIVRAVNGSSRNFTVPGDGPFSC